MPNLPNFFTKKIHKVLFAVCLFLVLSANAVFAQNAAFSLESAVTNLQLNEAFLIQAFINAPQTEINTIHLEINYSPEALLLEDISFSNSVFSNIVERGVGSPGVVNLTAFTIDPYKGSHGLVATLKFKAKEEGTANINILSSSKIHLADGRGTNVFNYQMSQKALSFTISQNSQSADSTSLHNSGSNSTAGFLNQLFSPFRKKSLLAAQDAVKEEQLFPEKQVTDYTKSPQTKLRKLINQLKATGGTVYLLITLLFVLGLAILVLITMFVFLSKKGKPPYGS